MGLSRRGWYPKPSQNNNLIMLWYCSGFKKVTWLLCKKRCCWRYIPDLSILKCMWFLRAAHASTLGCLKKQSLCSFVQSMIAVVLGYISPDPMPPTQPSNQSWTTEQPTKQASKQLAQATGQTTNPTNPHERPDSHSIWIHLLAHSPQQCSWNWSQPRREPRSLSILSSTPALIYIYIYTFGYIWCLMVVETNNTQLQ